MLELVRGSVVWARPDFTVGREQDGHRPSVVVASAAYLSVVDALAIVVPITGRERGWPNHIPLTGEHGLHEASWAMTEQIHAISRSRITKVSGTVDQGTLSAIDRWLRDFLDLSGSQLAPDDLTSRLLNDPEHRQ